MGKVISLLFAPTQDPCLIKQSALVRSCPAAPQHSILQNPRGMGKQPTVLFTFCADVEAYLRTDKLPNPRGTYAYIQSMKSLRKTNITIPNLDDQEQSDYGP